MNIVYFTGSLPRKGESPHGGGEVGNVRTIKMLESYGYQVKVIPKSRSKAEKSWLSKQLTFPFRVIGNAIRLFFALLFGNRKSGLVHLSGFAGITIFVETVQVFIIKLLGYRLLYELRGGGAIDFYEKGDAFYKKQFRYIVKKADYIFSQGKENEPFLNSLSKAPVFHYPNCVQYGFYPEELPPKPTDTINLIFYGRIEFQKNPIMIVRSAALLQKQFDKIRLTMLGNGQPELLNQVKNEMEKTLRSGTFELLPGCEHQELQKVLLDKHFYVFPSEQPREGQSNAVTEAMSFGIIPISSPQGFSRSTIGDDRLIVDELSAESYADRIAAIINEGTIEKYSSYVRNRFMEYYTEKAVTDKMKGVYASIFKER